MNIGFSNGNLWRLNSYENERFEDVFVKFFSIDEVNAIELHCSNEQMIDYLLENQCRAIQSFEFISIHAPSLLYNNNEQAHRILYKIELVCKKYNVYNVVFHTDKILDWDIIAQYHDIPVSIENMDDRKIFGKTLSDVKSILDKYDFGLTLDLQHCFVNDKTMKLAIDFQTVFKERIVEYHISGFKNEVLHYSLFKTRQDIIIDSLLYKNKPIIIESEFEIIGEQITELAYILHRFK